MQSMETFITQWCHRSEQRGRTPHFQTTSMDKGCFDIEYRCSMESILTTLKPIYMSLCMTNMEGCMMGLLYRFMYRIQHELVAYGTLDDTRYHDCTLVPGCL